MFFFKKDRVTKTRILLISDKTMKLKDLYAVSFWYKAVLSRNILSWENRKEDLV